MDLSGLWTWIGSGWGDALQSWEHPVDSVSAAANSAMAGWDTFGFGTDPNAGPGSSAGSPAASSGTSGSSVSNWAVVAVVIVVLFLVVVLIHEVEGIV